MEDQSFNATFIASIKDKGELCQLTIAISKLLVLLEGATVLLCISVDDIEAAASAEIVGVAPRRALCLLRTVDGSADVVCLLDEVSDARLIIDAIHTMRGVRQSRGVSLPKFVDYHYQGEHALHALLEPEEASVVKWRKGTPAPMPPFPHSRLDFLRLFLNKSVMQKVSSVGDKSIELSCDHVTAFGSHMSNDSDLVTDLVLLLTDRHLYLTKPSGVLVTRIEVQSICAVRLTSQHEVSLALATRKELSIRCRYCQEIAHRVRPIINHDVDLRASNGPRGGEVCSVSTQTETSILEDDVTAHSEYHLQLLLKKAVEEVQEKSALIELQCARIDSLTDKPPKNSKQVASKVRETAEIDVLRHYSSLLEVECDRLRNERSADLIVQEMPLPTLTEARLRVHKLENANQRLTSQLEELSRSFQRSVEESTLKSLTTARTFIRTLERRWMSEKKSLSVTYPPQGAQYKRLRDMNAKLIDELRDRDRLIESLVKSDDPTSNFPKYFADQQRKIEEASATLDTLTTQLAATEFHLESLQAKVAVEAVRTEAINEEAAVTSKIGGALSCLTLQAARVANLEAMLLQSTQKKIDILQLQERNRSLEKEVASLRILHRRKVATSKVVADDARSPRPSERKIVHEERSRIVSLSPVRDDALRLHEELEAQRIAFERRLQGLESIAFPSHASMGVVEPMLQRNSHSPSKQAAVIEAQNILLRSHSPHQREFTFRTAR